MIWTYGFEENLLSARLVRYLTRASEPKLARPTIVPATRPLDDESVSLTMTRPLHIRNVIYHNRSVNQSIKNKIMPCRVYWT